MPESIFFFKCRSSANILLQSFIYITMKQEVKLLEGKAQKSQSVSFIGGGRLRMKSVEQN